MVFPELFGQKLLASDGIEHDTAELEKGELDAVLVYFSVSSHLSEGYMRKSSSTLILVFYSSSAVFLSCMVHQWCIQTTA
jgi:hypothetical protein